MQEELVSMGIFQYRGQSTNWQKREKADSVHPKQRVVKRNQIERKYKL